MEICILKNVQEAGQSAGKKAAALLKAAALEKSEVRFMAAISQSQISSYGALLAEDILWDKIRVFHLDEYCNLPETHPASFRKYIRECFVSRITPKYIYYIGGTSNLNQTLSELDITATEKPTDVGMIGFGENAHTAFSDPPADFECPNAYHIVTLEIRCRKRQVEGGRLASAEDAPDQAVSASVLFIHSFQDIVSLIPYQVKATAVKVVLEAPERDISIPRTALLNYPNWFLYFNCESTLLLDLSKVKG